MYLCFVMRTRVGGGSCMLGLPAVYHHWSLASCWRRKVTPHFLCKLKHRLRSFRDTHVRPCQVCKLFDGFSGITLQRFTGNWTKRFHSEIRSTNTYGIYSAKHAFIWILKALPIFCHAVLITQGTVLDIQVKKNQTILQDILVYGYKHFHALVQHRNTFWGTLMLPAVNNNRPGIIVG